MSQVTSFFAISATPNKAANSPAPEVDRANSPFAALLAQLQGPQGATNIAPIQPISDTTVSVSQGQLISAIASNAEHTPASALLHSTASTETTSQESVSPSDLAGQLLAAQQTELAKLIHAALGIQPAEQVHNVAAPTNPQLPSVTNTVLDASSTIPLQDLIAALPAAEGPTASDPAFAQLIANAAKDAMRPSTSETNGAVNNTKPKSNNAPSDANTALTPGAGAAQTDSATSHVNDVSPHSDKQSHSENSNQGQQHALHANVNAKPTDTSIQAAGLASQTTPTFTTELEQVQHTPSGTPLLAQVPLDALAVQIARRFEQGISKFDISLHPADLGKLEISLNVSDDGRVQAVLRAERSDTLDLLRQDSRALENQLRQAGLEVGSNALSFQLSQGNGNRQNLNASHAFRGDESLEAGDATQASTSQYIAVRKRDGLDIHV